MAGEKLSDQTEDFTRFQEGLYRRFGDAIVTSWMSDLRVERKTDDSVILSTESQLKCETLGQRFVMLMKETWCEEVGPIRRMTITTRKRLSAGAARIDGLAGKMNGANSEGSPFERTGKERVPFIARTSERELFDNASPTSSSSDVRGFALEDILSPLDERSTFERFAVDDSNRMAYAAARQAASEAGASEVVYIYGQSGVGKTHLLHAAGNFWRNLHGDKGCAYLAYHNMTTGCSNAAFQNGGLHALHKNLLSQQIVLIDDIHLLAGAVRTQTEILNLINAAVASGRRLVIAGELSPAKLAEAGMNKRLTDRLAGGICVAVAPGGPALRSEVLKKRIEAEAPKCRVSDAAVDYISTHFPGSMREALGALKNLLLFYREEDKSVDLAEAAAALRSRLGDVRRTPCLDELAEETAKVFEVTVDELKGRGQPQRLARARHAFVYSGRRALRESFPRIAKALCRDHTTAMSGYRRAEALLERDKKFQAAVKEIFEALGYAMT